MKRFYKKKSSLEKEADKLLKAAGKQETPIVDKYAEETPVKISRYERKKIGMTTTLKNALIKISQ